MYYLFIIRLSGVPPFDEEKKPIPLYEQIQNGLYEFPLDFWSDISQQGFFLIFLIDVFILLKLLI